MTLEKIKNQNKHFLNKVFYFFFDNKKSVKKKNEFFKNNLLIEIIWSLDFKTIDIWNETFCIMCSYSEYFLFYY